MSFLEDFSDWIEKQKYFKQKRRVLVKLPSGKTYWRNQWVLPGEAKTEIKKRIHKRKLDRLVVLSQKKNPNGPEKVIRQSLGEWTHHNLEDIKRLIDDGYKIRFHTYNW